MDRSRTMGMLIALVLMISILGIISGVIWAFSLSADLNNGMIYGGIVGGIIGFLNFLSINSSVKSGKFQSKEGIYSLGSLLTGIFIISTILALAIGLIRWIFF